MTNYIHREQDILQWGIDRNIIGPSGKSNQRAQHRKTEEEVTELSDAIHFQCRDSARDAIGDIIVTLTLQANMWQLTLGECIEAAYNEILDRKGSMVDGIFVKE